MHSDDFKKIVSVIGRTVRSIATLVIIPLYVLMFPLQLVCWIFGNNRFMDTEPYRFLSYFFDKIAGETKLSYENWKQKNRKIREFLKE